MVNNVVRHSRFLLVFQICRIVALLQVLLKLLLLTPAAALAAHIIDLLKDHGFLLSVALGSLVSVVEHLGPIPVYLTIAR